MWLIAPSVGLHAEGKGSVMKATKGIAFGELALLHNAPRAATVTAESPVTAWALDEISFKMILMGKSQKDATDYMAFLKNVPILKQCLERGEDCLGDCPDAAYFGPHVLEDSDRVEMLRLATDAELHLVMLVNHRHVRLARVAAEL